MRRRVTLAVEALVAAIVAVALLVRWMEPRIAFYPVRGETETPRNYGVPFEPLDIVTPEGDHLRAWILRAANPRANIVYFHGNGGNLSDWAPILTGIVRHGYSVFAFDYRGYGLSTGRPTELGLYHDAGIIASRAWMNDAGGVPIIYWGRSLGATMAAYAATAHAPDGLVLESGFPDARAAIRDSPVLVILSLFGTYRFPTAELANRTKRPILVMHGTKDGVIPFRAGRELYDRLAGPKRFVAIEGGDHNDAVPRDADLYWSAVDGFIASLHR
jgi:fermentation-respiration switch protein FrsA (DUF1100 family)